MRTSSAIVYAAAAFMPALLFVAAPFAGGDALFFVGEVAVGISWLACALYVVYALRSPTVPREKRGLWVAVLILGSAFTFPFFWFWYVWQPTRPRNA